MTIEEEVIISYYEMKEALRDLAGFNADRNKQQALKEAKIKLLETFNPDSDVVIKKNHLTALEGLKSVADLKDRVEQVLEMQKDISVKVKESHSVLKGDFISPKPEKKLTKKERERLELMELSRAADLRQLYPAQKRK